MTARGLKCQIGITEGQECLSVPVPLIISDDVILRTDLALALLQISAVDAESVKLIWTMVDRHDPDSHFAAFWQALPLAIETGLTASELQISVLQATPGWNQIQAAST